ncbi:MAG: GntR family transcriptional regulator [Burkholderiaceae bacterium]|jgi:DNA-binding GntR family transcriptional regulator|nr:GntR family transcriptional regulator [Burkholderiaceae bacterium]
MRAFDLPQIYRGLHQADQFNGSLLLTKYHQIYLVLRQQLSEGYFLNGPPGEKALAEAYGVGRVTIRRALDQLAHEGLIAREVGGGTRPASSKPKTQAQGVATPEEDLVRKPMLQISEESGVDLGRATQAVSARQADALAARELQVPLGSALLCLRRLVFDVNDRPVEGLHGLYRPDRYEYEMEISQIGGIEARNNVKKIISP